MRPHDSGQGGRRFSSATSICRSSADVPSRSRARPVYCATPRSSRRSSHGLARNDTKVLVLSSRRDRLAEAVGERSPGGIDAAARNGGVARAPPVVAAGRSSPAVAAASRRRCRELALRLGVFKLVWIDPQGGMRAPSGERLSFVHQDELRRTAGGDARRIGRDRIALLREVDRMLSGGLPAVNVCTLEGLREELFTYTGSGTLFTRKRYIAVRDLGLDDFDAAYDLIARRRRGGLPRVRGRHARSTRSSRAASAPSSRARISPGSGRCFPIPKCGRARSHRSTR